jgi:hypothetical protein
MEFKNIKERVDFFKKQESRVKSLKESQSEFSIEDSLFKHLAPAFGFSIISVIFFDTIFALSFGLSFLIGGVFLEYHGIKKSNLNKLMAEFPIEGVSSIEEYEEQLKVIAFREEADENYQVAKELLAQLEAKKLSQIENEKNLPP